MEFPELGSQCSDPDCRQLDFLPIKCDACKKTFCATHYKFAAHDCRLSQRRNNVVPTCGLCGAVVLAAGAASAEEAMASHLEKNCKPYKKTRIYTNRCNARACKRKGLVGFQCDECGLSFCVGHRHALDHACGGKRTPREAAAAAAIERAEGNAAAEPEFSLAAALGSCRVAAKEGAGKESLNQKELESLLTNVNGEMSEDAALAKALAESEAEAKRHEPRLVEPTSA